MIEFLAAYWLWILLIGGFVLMHRGGGCGADAAEHAVFRRRVVEMKRLGIELRGERFGLVLVDALRARAVRLPHGEIVKI